MAIENPPASQEGRLSGAYIRTLVKQLTTSPKPKPKTLSKNNTTTTNNNHNENIILSENNNTINNHNIVGDHHQYYSGEKEVAMAKQPTPQSGQQGGGHKKQVRRRLHTSRPYQERLLNMAEARKEIVTALKFHRATMKQANERKQQQQQQQQQHFLDQQYHHPQFTLGVVDHEEAHGPNSAGLCASSYYPSYHNNYHNGNFYHHPWNNISSPSLIEPPPINHYETLNMPLPNQTLGLNLNLQAFTNLDTTFSHSTRATNTPTISSIMSPSSSSSSVPGDPTSAGPINAGAAANVAALADSHPALDEGEMARIRSIGEKHQIEWDDTLNLVKSAWWLKFLKEFGTKEMKREEEIEIGNGDDEEYHPFGELMEFPAWLSANEGFLQQHLDECCPQEYWKDNTLPWMDIGDIDGMDDEWLS